MPVARTFRALAAAAILSALALAGPAFAQDVEAVPESYEKNLRAYLEIHTQLVSYGDNVALQAANETLMQIANSGTQVTEQIQQIVLEEAQAKFGEKLSDLDYLAKLWAPIYAKHFTEEELKAILDFWSSPVGRKTIEVTPQLTQDSFSALRIFTITNTPAYHMAIDARLRELGMGLTVTPSGN
ncbi:MAG: DUF2059 domain-containing protein [Myxococcota bacterium]